MSVVVYIAHTPYQMMGALNIISNTPSNKRHILMLVHANLEKYLGIANFFPNVEVVLEKRLFLHYKVLPSFWAHVDIMKKAIMLKSKVKELTYLKNKDISELFVPSDDIICRVVYNYVNKRNNNIVLSLYDDGVGTYDLHTFKKIGLGELFYKCFLDSNYSSRIKNLYCYKTSLVSTNNLKLKYHDIISSDIVKQAFCSCLNDDISKYYKKKVIFLDQGFSNYESVKTCFSLLDRYFEKQDVLIKTHPRVSASTDFPFETSNDGFPFEIIAATIDLSQCLIISYSSGGCITPVLMYGEKGGVSLFLITIDDNGDNGPAVQFFNRVRKELGDDVVYMPKSVHDLEDFLNSHSYISGAKRK